MWLLAVLVACLPAPPREPVPRVAIEGRFALSPPVTGAGTVVGTWLASGGDIWLTGVQAPDGTRRAYRVAKSLDAVELEVPKKLPKGAWFGMSGAASGDWAAVGAAGDPEGDKGGTVELYIIGEDGWAWDRQLTFEDASPAVGLAMTTDGTWLAVPDRETGAIHMVSTETWEVTQTVTASVPGIMALAIEGDTMLAGAPDADTVLAFHNDGGTWSEVGPLPGAAGGRFGAAVAVTGGRAVVGAPDAAGGDGEVHLYSGSPGSYSEVITLSPGKSGVSAHLGTTVALVGDVVLAGAPAEMTSTGQEPGVVEAFAECGGAWKSGARLAGAGAAGDGFGAAITVSGDTLLAASPNATGSGGRRGRVDGMRIRPPRCVIPGER